MDAMGLWEFLCRASKGRALKQLCWLWGQVGSVCRQRLQKLPRARSGARGEPGAAQAACPRGPPPGRAGGGGGAPGPPSPPLVPPFGIYLARVPKPSRTEPFFAISSLFRRRRASKIGSTRRTLPGTLPEGRITTGSFSTTMDASRMSCE